MSRGRKQITTKRFGDESKTAQLIKNKSGNIDFDAIILRTESALTAIARHMGRPAAAWANSPMTNVNVPAEWTYPVAMRHVENLAHFCTCLSRPDFTAAIRVPILYIDNRKILTIKRGSSALGDSATTTTRICFFSDND